LDRRGGSAAPEKLRLETSAGRYSQISVLAEMRPARTASETVVSGVWFSYHKRRRVLQRRTSILQSARLNEWPWFEQADLAGGGTLALEMGPRPNQAWGSAPEAAPPSMSKEKE
jgi:hypothetical protein